MTKKIIKSLRVLSDHFESEDNIRNKLPNLDLDLLERI
jgi:hypothetical protein